MSIRTLTGTAIWVACSIGSLAGQSHSHTTKEPNGTVPIYDNLGDLHREITTTSPLAQQYFDQGLRLTLGFNHGEAIIAYREAVNLDPACAMCYWGIAWAFGPNINAAMDSASGAKAFEASTHAVRLADHATPNEKALIHAMAQRYDANPLSPRAKFDSSYASAMGQVATDFPDDAEAQILHAEALMMLSPWDYWTAEAKPRPGTDVLVKRLTDVLERNPRHPGACHFYIHAVEAAYPEWAVPCAERLPSLMPGAGHLVHMPAHVFIRVGRYADAIEANVHAVHADEQYIADRRPDGLYPLAYYPHNYHFLGFAAQMAGQSHVAIDAARSVASKVDISSLQKPGFETLQHLLVAPYRVMVRFGMWEEILDEPAPPTTLAYASGMWHWARGFALLRRGELDDAAHALVALERATQTCTDNDFLIWGINPASHILNIASLTLRAELSAARKNWDAAVENYERAAALEDDLTYDEPPTWELPVRHFLGAALQSAGRFTDAERVYREDLKRFPNNGWALTGLMNSLKAQGRTGDMANVRLQLQDAWRIADVVLDQSRF